MSDIANYTFLPWLRQGIANKVTGHNGIRATIDVTLSIFGQKLGGGTDVTDLETRSIEIYGPGDVIGIEQSAIIKSEPRNWVADFEPNYLPYIEFYDEDFPWRYSAVSSQGGRLTPWIMLITLAEDEFDDGRNLTDRPLPYLTLSDRLRLPSSDQLWAWAHVHVDKNIIGAPFVSNDDEQVASTLGSVLRANPDLAHSRLLCPRKLEPKTGYHAFVVPTFEAGRLAGLGLDLPADLTHDVMAWSDTVQPAELPYYHRWFFRTGAKGDFEYLVRLLEPQPVDSRVGVRDMDVRSPGANIQGIVDAADAPEDQQLNGVLKLGGALRVPDSSFTPDERAIVEKYRRWATLNGTADPPHPFQRDLAAFVNLSDQYQATGAVDANTSAGITEVEATEPGQYGIANNPDPLITAPLYGRWHALTQRLLTERDGSAIAPDANWVHELNLDPRWRVAAGFGTKVVQEHQETYMAAAWDQVGEVLEANKRIRQAQLARETASVWYTEHLDLIRAKHHSRWLKLAAPLQPRVLRRGVTVHHAIGESRVPSVVFSPPMRRILSPRGRLADRLPFTDQASVDNLADRINAGEVSAAPEREVPNLPTDEDLADHLEPEGVPNALADLLRRHRWIRWLPLAVLLVLMVILLALAFTGGPLLPQIIGWPIVVALAVLQVTLLRLARRVDIGNSVLGERQTPETVDELPNSPDFELSRPEDGYEPTVGGSVDSPEAVRFKDGLRNMYELLQTTAVLGAAEQRPSVDLVALSTATFNALDPRVTVPNWVEGAVTIPPRISGEQDDAFVEAMAYPRIDLPMYQPLAEQSAELFLPNLNHVAENSVSLLETNQAFIEAYMVGLNHEFARELLWREYPTDQRGSYFRQFWEPRGFQDNTSLDAEERKERLRDIPPLHRWLKRSQLGDHDHREAQGDKEEEVVLVIRGELLKRYPNAVIYAHRAVWRDDTDEGKPILDIGRGQTIDLSKERDLYPLTDVQAANPPRDLLKSPLYEAKVEPDIYFFGFDLTACKAKGGTGDEASAVDVKCAAEGVEWHDAGWFFVIKERPGEIALGLDVPGDSDNIEDVKVWNDLSWGHVTPTVGDGGYLQISSGTDTIVLRGLDLPNEVEKQDQHDEDLNISWNREMNSADLAYVLHQVPVLVAVHSAEMLPAERPATEDDDDA